MGGGGLRVGGGGLRVGGGGLDSEETNTQQMTLVIKIHISFCNISFLVKIFTVVLCLAGTQETLNPKTLNPKPPCRSDAH